MKNKSSLIVKISDISDLNNITKDTKYINLDIVKINYDVIKYFTEHGKKYLYSAIIDNTLGYTFASYEDFITAEKIIDIIYLNMPNDLTPLEIARYIYINLAKYISFDINSDYEKTDLYNLNLISKINNLWSSLAIGRVTSKSASIIYYYLCKRLDINIDIIKEEEDYSNKLVINNKVLITNLFKDIPYIKANMQTRYFATYNDDMNLDKNIGYIKSKYNDYYIDLALKDIDYIKEDCINEILSKTGKIIDISSISPSELSIVYKYIFNKYCPNYSIKINNLFLNNHGKFHFIMISYNDNHYSYNYREKKFIKVNSNDIIDNINIGKIGLYLNEYIPNINNY